MTGERKTPPVPTNVFFWAACPAWLVVIQINTVIHFHQAKAIHSQSRVGIHSLVITRVCSFFFVSSFSLPLVLSHSLLVPLFLFPEAPHCNWCLDIAKRVVAIFLFKKKKTPPAPATTTHQRALAFYISAVFVLFWLPRPVFCCPCPVHSIPLPSARDKVRIGLPAWRINDPPPPRPPPLLERDSPDEIVISLLVQTRPCANQRRRVGLPLLSCPSGTFHCWAKPVLRISLADVDLQTFFFGFLSRTRTATPQPNPPKRGRCYFLSLSLFPAASEDVVAFFFYCYYYFNLIKRRVLPSVFPGGHACALRQPSAMPSRYMPAREFHIVVLGAGGVGKSCLTAQFVHNEWIESYDPTIEDSYRTQVSVDGRQVVLEILDTAGTEQFVAMRDLYMKTGQGFLLVFSITSMSSLSELAQLREEIIRIKEDDNAPIVICGNKADLEDQRTVARTKAFSISQRWHAPYYEASARTRSKEIMCPGPRRKYLLTQAFLDSKRRRGVYRSLPPDATSRQHAGQSLLRRRRV
ncbi:hypothetical protein RB594_005038 [Gaeumannomyces avenae]